MAIARHKTRPRELREARRLIRRAQRGDRRAFELLYATYEGRLYRFCHRLTGSDEAAAGLVQATFPRALADLPDIETLDVAAHLHGTARSLAHARNGVPGPERSGDVATANQRLAPRQRAVLALRDLEGRPDAEIAGVLGTDEAAVAALAARARLRLRTELGLPPVAAACREHLAELAAYADGLLPAEQRGALEAHIAGCARCRAALFALREASLRYRALPAPEPQGELGSRIARALGGVGIPQRRADASAAEPVASGGRQTTAAAVMAALVIVGAGVTIAATRDSHEGGKPAPAPVAPPPQASSPTAEPPASASSSSIAAHTTTRRAPPAVHHLRARGGRSTRHAAARKPPLFAGAAIPAPEGAPPGTAAAPTSPPASPAKPLKRPVQIPVEILPPATPAHPPAAADTSPPPSPPEPPPPPDQTTTT